MHYTRAIVRPPPPTFAAGLTSAHDCAPDLALALVQHRAYCQALSDCGLTLTTLPAEPAYPDSCFVEDPVVVTERGAIATRPGAPSRMGEVDSIIAALRRWYPDIARITAPGTLDGGDVCEVDGHFLIGRSARTNEAGGQQLAEFLEMLGYRASIVDVRGNRPLLHLKTGMSYIGHGRIVAVAELPEIDALRTCERVVVSGEESFAANCIQIDDRVLIAAGCPRLARTLTGLGYDPVPVELSEFRKMDGALTCLSLRF